VLEPAEVAGAVAADFSWLIKAWIRQIGLESWRHGIAHLVVSLSARVERDPAHRAGHPDDDMSAHKSGPAEFPEGYVTTPPLGGRFSGPPEELSTAASDRRLPCTPAARSI
jgi:hypothetical protein